MKESNVSVVDVKEIPWFFIGQSYGGNQDWMRDPWMKLGGCAALAAVDTCLVLTRNLHLKKLCPLDAFQLTEDSYINFAMVMKPYLRPRFSGVDKLDIYIDGFTSYLQERDVNRIQTEGLPMGCPKEKAEAAIRSQIDAGIPVPMLHLRPKCAAADEYEWHWFMLNGYQECNGYFQIKATTYGSFEWIALSDLWHEEDATNGGLILYHIMDEKLRA